MTAIGGHFQMHGNDAVATLNDHFSPVLRDAGIDTDSVETEWALLKTLLQTCDS